MTAEPGKTREEKQPYTPEIIPATGEIAYNLDDSKTPGGLKVRWKIRIATGKEADRVAARQAEAIKEILQWASRQQTRQGGPASRSR